MVTGDILIRETLGDASFVHVLADPCKRPAEIRDLLTLLQSEGSKSFFFSFQKEKKSPLGLCERCGCWVLSVLQTGNLPASFKAV